MTTTQLPQPVLALYGDQLETDVWNLHQGRVISVRHHTGAEGGRPWLPFDLRPSSGKRAPLTIRPACGKCNACRRDFPCTVI